MVKSRDRPLSAGAIPIHRGPTGCRFLLLRVYAYWDFPKGRVEPGEEPLQAALREVEEETGLAGLAFPWGKEYRETPPYGHGKVARYYVAEALDTRVSLPVNPELGHPEHHEFRWVDYQEARRRLAPRVQPILDWAHRVSGCDA